MTSGPTVSATSESLATLHVLVVDDDTTFLEVVQALLKSIGVVHITKATSGREAFEKLLASNRVVDVILCDYQMPQGTGLELLWVVRTAQAKSVRADACFLLVTSSREHATVTIAAQLDVSGYLVKPVTAEKLRTAIVQGRKRAIKIDIAKYKQIQLPPA